MLPNHDAIEKMTLRWRGRADQAYVPATQMRVERRFSELNFSPPGLPPNVMVYIKSIRDLPPLAGLDFIPSGWAEQVRQQVAAYYQQAVRPQQGYITPEAESVIFADQAEMLTALTLAVIAGRWWDHWLWAEIIPMLHPSDALSTAWGRAIQYLPAAFSQLRPSQMLTAVHLLTPAARNRLIQQLRVAFNMPEATLSAAPIEATDAASSAMQSDKQQAVTFTPDTSPSTAIEPPWLNWLPTSLSHSTVPRPEQHLLGLIISLHRNPSHVRSAHFAEQTARWLAASPASEVAEQPHKLVITTRSDSDQSPQPTINNAAPHSVDATGLQIAASEETPLAEPVIPSTLEVGQWTGYGGILYLINLLSWLGMPQDWDEALTRHVSAWGFIELLARALLPPEFIDSDDIIWTVFTSLNNRELNSLIGADFPAPSSFQLPANVLRRFAPKQLHWRAAVVNDRLRLFDDTYLYLVAEQPLNGRDAAEVIESLIGEYQAQGISATWVYGDDHPDQTLPPFLISVCSPALQSWLQKALGFVRYWLQQIAELSPIELLLVRGRIAMTFTHVDLFMAIENIDIRIRKVGLDRNPGWMPDFGYIILFHFDE